MSKRENISAVDTAWLRMDRPANLMMICGVLTFDRRLSLARLRAVIDERFLVFRRFRQVRAADGDRRAVARRSRVRHRDARRRDEAAAAGRRRRAAASRVDADGDAAAARAADVAVPPRHQSSRRLGADRADPPLLRRRHRARARDAVDDRRERRMARRRCRSTRRSAASSATDDPLTELLGPLTGVVKSARKIGRMLLDKGASVLARSRAGGGARDAGRCAHRRDREARDDGRGFADALQGTARRRQARRVGRAAAARRREDGRDARSTRRSTTCCCRASPARYATT